MVNPYRHDLDPPCEECDRRIRNYHFIRRVREHVLVELGWELGGGVLVPLVLIIASIVHGILAIDACHAADDPCEAACLAELHTPTPHRVLGDRCFCRESGKTTYIEVQVPSQAEEN